MNLRVLRQKIKEEAKQFHDIGMSHLVTVKDVMSILDEYEAELRDKLHALKLNHDHHAKKKNQTMHKWYEGKIEEIEEIIG